MGGLSNIAIAQLNPTVGAIEHNVAMIKHAMDDARTKGAELIVFSELVVTGYPPEDLVYRPAFLTAVEGAVRDLAAYTEETGVAALISAPWRMDGQLYNAALLLSDGIVQAAQAKVHLPNFGVFDEKRVFAEGALPSPIEFNGRKLGVMICEDLWHDDVAAHLAGQGADVFIALNASQFEDGKCQQRIALAKRHADAHKLPFIYVNQVGGQDEVVYDGGSFVLSADGIYLQQLPFFEAGFALAQGADVKAPEYDRLAHMYQAMVLALRDYIGKNGFPGILLGLSGGVDSALSAAVAVDAIGADKVQCVMMPSRYTSGESHTDAQQLADNLGTPYDVITIADIAESYHQALPKDAPSIMFENIQSRARGVVLMGLSNANGKMVLSTGNKSEVAVGYATIYGDMCGGYNVLKDAYKTDVYALCEWLNAQKGFDYIPRNIITKAPTAELRDNQKDQDNLPDYDTLDTMLRFLIEEELPPQAIAEKTGYDIAEIQRIERLLTRAEYKRRQAAPGVKLTATAFGRERRYPITNGFVEK